MYKNYIFDFYGTIVDVGTNEEKVFLWRKMKLWLGMYGVHYEKATDIKKRYRELVRELENNAGRENAEINIEDVFKKMFAEKGVKITDEFAVTTAQFFRIISLDFVAPYEGVVETLAKLKEEGKKVYLLTNAQRIFTEPEIKMLGLDEYFDGIVYSSDEGVKKPDVEFFDVIFKRYNLKKEESIFIGNDHLADIKGASSYGINSLYIYTSISPKFPGAGILPKSCKEIKHFEDVLKSVEITEK